MSRSGPAHAARAVDASMGLLNEVTARPVEPGYAEAAARPPVRRTTTGRVRLAGAHLSLAMVLGLLTVGAITSLRAPQSAVQQSRALLGEQIAERSAHADETASGNVALSAEIAQLQSDALEAASPRLFASLAESELLSGSVAVQGPGLLVELDDAPSPDPNLADPASRVQDLDLQVVVNGLWQAGAEAVAVNGVRLTALSAIRSAGPAILVDLSPLLPPYRVEAIGDARAMQTQFARTSGATHLALLSSTYQIAVSTRAVEDLTLAGAGTTTLRHASVLARDVASSVPAEKGGTP